MMLFADLQIFMEKKFRGWRLALGVFMRYV